jgi:hypothetical protein
MSIYHAKTVTIADDPAVVASGGVVPSDYNAAHVINIDGVTIHTHSNQSNLNAYDPSNFIAAAQSSNIQYTSNNGNLTANAMNTSERNNYIPIAGSTAYQTSNLSQTFLTTAMQSNAGSNFIPIGNSSAYQTATLANTFAQTASVIPLANSTAYQTSVLSNTFAPRSNVVGVQTISTVATDGTNLTGSAGSGGITIAVPAFVTNAAGGGGATVNGTSGNITITAGGAIGLTNNASTISISAPVQSVQPSYVVMGTNSTGGTSTGSGSTVSFSNGNGVSFWVTNNSQINAAVVTNYSTGYSAKAESTHGHSFGTTATAGSQLTIGTGSAGVSIGMPAFITTYAAQTVDINKVGIGNISTVVTAGSLMTGSAGTNGITLAVPAYVTAAAGGGDGVNIVSLGTVGTTGTAWSALSATLALNGGGIVTVSQNNSNQLVINAPAQTDLTNHAHTAYSTGIQGVIYNGVTQRTGDVILSGRSGITVNSGAGGTCFIDFDGHHMDGFIASGNNAGTAFSSMSTGTMGFNFAGILSGSQVANNLTLSVPIQSVQPNQTINMSAVGVNTAGSSATTQITGTGFSISGAGIISAGYSGQTLIVSAPAQTDLTNHGHTGYIPIAGSSAYQTATLANTFQQVSASSAYQTATLSTALMPLAYSSGFQTGTLANTFFQAANSTLLAGSSVASRVVGIAGSSASTGSGIIQFANGNGVSFGLSNNGVMTASVAAGGGATSGAYYVTQNSTGGSSSGSYALSSLNIIGAGIASVGNSGNSLVISVPAGGGGGDGYNIVSAGSVGTTGTAWSSLSASVGINGSGAITVSQNNSNQLVINAPAMSVLSAVTNCTLGTTGSTIGISVGAGGAGVTPAIQGSNGSFSFSTVTMGSSNGIHFYTTNGSVVASYADPDAINILGNTAGASASIALTNGSLYLAGGNNITLSQNGSTVTIVGAAGGGGGGTTLDRWWNPIIGPALVTVSGQTNASASIMQMILPSAIQFSRIDIPMAAAVASTTVVNVACFRMSNVVVLYTRTGNTLNPICGASNTQSFAWSSNATASVGGSKYLSMGLATTLPPDEYWIGFHCSTANSISSASGTNASTALGATLSVFLQSIHTTHFLADFGATTNVSFNGVMQGLISSAITNTTQTLQVSQISQTGANLGRAVVPMRFRNV